MILRCHAGIVELKFAKPDSNFSRSSSYHFEQATEDFVTADTTLMDPLDHRNVFIAPSGKLILLYKLTNQAAEEMSCKIATA